MKGLAPALVEEAVIGLWRARRMTAVSTAQIAVSIVLVGVFLLVAENLKGVTETVRDETAVTVFLAAGATDENRADIQRLARESGLVKDVRRVSPEEARARFARTWSTLASAVTSIPVNPFPESFELDLLPDAARSQALPPFLRNLAERPGIAEVQFDVEWVRRLRGVVTLVKTAGIAIGVFLAFGAAFTIANVVRLTILLHREEIEILRLVGAPELLIRGPFLLGGVAQGLLGAVVALLLLRFGFSTLVHWVASTENRLLGMFLVRFLPTPFVAALVGGGILAGLLGGAFAVRKRNLDAGA